MKYIAFNRPSYLAPGLITIDYDSGLINVNSSTQIGEHFIDVNCSAENNAQMIETIKINVYTVDKKPFFKQNLTDKSIECPTNL